MSVGKGFTLSTLLKCRKNHISSAYNRAVDMAVIEAVCTAKVWRVGKLGSSWG